MRRGVMVMAGLLVACSGTPKPAKDLVGVPPGGRGIFTGVTAHRGILLDLEDRGAGAELVDKIVNLVGAEARDAGIELVREKDVEVFRDVDTRAPLVGRQTDGDLARVATHLGADRVLAGWVGRSEDVLAFQVRVVTAEGVVLNQAAGVSRGTDADHWIVVRRAAGKMFEKDPPPEGESLTTAELVRQIKRREGFLHACLAEAAMGNPMVAGRAVVDMTVGPGGDVRWAEVRTSTFGDRSLELCLKAAATSIVVPHPPTSDTSVSHPVILAATLPGADAPAEELPPEEDPLNIE